MMKQAILYSFRRCPYAMRARWAILNCNLKVELREIDLKNKPDEMIEISQKATVPVLITNEGHVLDESLDIIKWSITKAVEINQFDQNSMIYSERTKNLIIENDLDFKNHLDHFKYPNRYPKSNREDHRLLALKILYKWNDYIKESLKKDKCNYFLSGKESLEDWAIWPFVRQYRNVDIESFDKDQRLNNIKIWLNFYLNNNYYTVLMKRYKPWKNTDLPCYFPC